MASLKNFDKAVDAITVASGNTATIIDYPLSDNQVAHVFGNIQCKNNADPPNSETYRVCDEFRRGTGTASKVGEVTDLIGNLPHNLSTTITKTTNGNNILIQVTNNDSVELDVMYNLDIHNH